MVEMVEVGKQTAPREIDLVLVSESFVRDCSKIIRFLRINYAAWDSACPVRVRLTMALEGTRWICFETIWLVVARSGSNHFSLGSKIDQKKTLFLMILYSSSASDKMFNNPWEFWALDGLNSVRVYHIELQRLGSCSSMIILQPSVDGQLHDFVGLVIGSRPCRELLLGPSYLYTCYPALPNGLYGYL